MVFGSVLMLRLQSTLPRVGHHMSCQVMAPRSWACRFMGPWAELMALHAVLALSLVLTCVHSCFSTTHFCSSLPSARGQRSQCSVRQSRFLELRSKSTEFQVAGPVTHIGTCNPIMVLLSSGKPKGTSSNFHTSLFLFNS